VTGAVDDALAAAWTRRGISLSRLEARSDGTLLGSERRRLEETATLASTPGIDASREVALSPQGLAFGDLIGRGGMGEVREAEQLGLRRTVAVKTSAGADATVARAALLKEAWVGAVLEHPSVVPVHTLARTELGPAIVMKRIAGRSLAEECELELRERGSGEVSERILRVLVQVANAVSFAHSRGVLHLDLKAENVMLGDHGEVYVLDWGLAAAHGDRGPTWLLPASGIREIAGTPTHMAPELAAADGPGIGPHTDVYLLGAMLHRVVTGRPLHDGGSLEEVLGQAWHSRPPELPRQVPAELAAIVRRAVAREPAARHPDAATFRDALEDHLRDRHADRIARGALEALREVDALVAAGASDLEIAPRLAEVESAIEQVHRDRPDRADVDALVDALLLRRARHAVASQRPAGARAFAARMSSAPAELLEAIEALERRLASREAHVLRLEELRRELDLTLGNAERRRVFAVLGASWTAVCLFFGWGARTGRFVMGYRELLVEGAVLVGLLVPYGVARRAVLFSNLANQRLYGGLALTAIAVELFWVAASWLGLPVGSALAITPAFYVYAFAMLGAVLDRRMALGAVPLALAGVVAALLPDYAHDAIGVGGGAAVAAVLAGRAHRAEPSPT
jgi:serine/threonine-protein kinase